MPRAHTKLNNRQTAAPGGCLFFYILPPLSVFLLAVLFSWVVLKKPLGLNSPSPAIGIFPIYTPEVQHWAGSISQWAARFDLDPDMVATIMQIESCGNPKAISSAGAMGLFQVMPFHFAENENPFNPNVNAFRGLAYLKRALESADGNARLAFAGYNGGISVIHRAESEWSAQTKRYVHYAESIYSEAGSGTSSSPSLSDWHQKYGIYLCLKARQVIGDL